MFDSNDFVKVIKKIAIDAVNASRPTDVVYGKVIGVSPLKIKVDQKLILTSAQLTLTRNVTDYKMYVTVDHTTESATTNGETHNHRITGKKQITVHNALEVGEKVIMVQMSGGQKYVVIDRIGKG